MERDLTTATAYGHKGFGGPSPVLFPAGTGHQNPRTFQMVRFPDGHWMKVDRTGRLEEVPMPDFMAEEAKANGTFLEMRPFFTIYPPKASVPA